MPDSSPEAARPEIQRCGRAAAFAVDMFVIDNANSLARCTKAVQTRLTVQAVLSYLFGQGLISVTSEWPEWLAMDIPEPLAADLKAALAEAVAQRDRINATNRFLDA